MEGREWKQAQPAKSRRHGQVQGASDLQSGWKRRQWKDGASPEPGDLNKGRRVKNWDHPAKIGLCLETTGNH